MRGLRHHSFGGEGLLSWDELEPLKPRRGEVLVTVLAAGLNPLDSKLYRGELKWISGLRMPQAVGLEFAGVVAEVGGGVGSLSVGDRVFGVPPGMPGRGAVAQQVCARQEQLAVLPESLSFEEGAALVIGGQTALHSLRDVARVQPGQRVLVHGCSGGVGLFAVQIAGLLRAQVDGVCGAKGLDLCRQLGASRVYDYRSQGLEALEAGAYDAILPLSGKLSFAEARRLLTPSGVYIDPTPPPWMWLWAPLSGLFRRQKRRPLVTRTRRDALDWLAQQADSGALQVHIGATFAFEETQLAYALLARGVLGKVVVQANSSRV